MASPDKQQKVMSGDPANTDQVALLRNNPFLAPMFGPGDDDAVPGAGADGSNNGVGQPKNAPGTSEVSSQPQTAATAASTTPNSVTPSSVPSMFAGMGSGNDENELEQRADTLTPGATATAQPQTRGQKAKNFLFDVLGRLGNAGYAISGGDPREMRLKEQGEQFEEEQQRMKNDPNYQARVAAATTAPEVVTSPNGNGGYQYTRIDKFSGAAMPTGVAAPMPEKTPAQLLGEFVQNHPDALTKGTPANIQYEELAEGLRAFPSNQAQIRADAEKYVGRMGVERARVEAQAIVSSMQGRSISDATKNEATALQQNLEAAAKGWAQFYTEHPYLAGMGYGPDPDSQARFFADTMQQLQLLSLEQNQLTQKIPGTTKVVPPANQVPIIGPAANAAGGGSANVQSFKKKHGLK